MCCHVRIILPMRVLKNKSYKSGPIQEADDIDHIDRLQFFWGEMSAKKHYPLSFT